MACIVKAARLKESEPRVAPEWAPSAGRRFPQGAHIRDRWRESDTTVSLPLHQAPSDGRPFGGEQPSARMLIPHKSDSLRPARSLPTLRGSGFH